MGLVRHARCLGVAAVLALSSGAVAEDPQPAEKRLKLDLDRLVRQRLEQDRTPRFEEHVEVTAATPQQLLGRFVEGADLDCEPAGVGPPSELEMREVRPGPTPYVDVLALAGAALAKLKARGPARFFVYRVTRHGRRGYVVREEESPREWQPGPEGAVIELVGGHPDRASALAAWRRLERGLQQPATNASPPPPFLASSCRPD